MNTDTGRQINEKRVKPNVYHVYIVWIIGNNYKILKMTYSKMPFTEMIASRLAALMYICTVNDE